MFYHVHFEHYHEIDVECCRCIESSITVVSNFFGTRDNSQTRLWATQSAHLQDPPHCSSQHYPSQGSLEAWFHLMSAPRWWLWQEWVWLPPPEDVLCPLSPFSWSWGEQRRSLAIQPALQDVTASLPLSRGPHCEARQVACRTMHITAVYAPRNPVTLLQHVQKKKKS